jgi:hypothetical protein
MNQKQRIEELERRVKELESRPQVWLIPQVPYVHYTPVPVCPVPTVHPPWYVTCEDRARWPSPGGTVVCSY